MARYINDDAVVTKGLRTANKITPAQLEQFMIQEYNNITLPVKTIFDRNNYQSDQQAWEDLTAVISYENKQIANDLSNIDFDLENLIVGDPSTKWYAGDTGTNLCGIQTLSSGLCFCGAVAGGDWEQPLFYILYHDKTVQALRAYIPICGNPVNCDTLSAFGSEVNLSNPNLPYNLPQLYDMYQSKKLLVPANASLTDFIDTSTVATDSYLAQYGNLRLDGAVPGKQVPANAGGFCWDAIKKELLTAITVV